jgi:hypothetical protein
VGPGGAKVEAAAIEPDPVTLEAPSGPLTPQLVATLQRTAGNRAVSALLQRQPKQVPVTDVSLNHRRVSVPPEAGLSLQATAVPGNATGVKFKVEKDTVEVKDVTIDASSGRITVGAKQPGGDLKVVAESDDGSTAWVTLRVIEKPTALTSTSASPKSGKVYGGDFTHTFSGPSGTQSGLEDARINETFDSTAATTPWGPFALAANKAGSPGWSLDSSGTMRGPDNVGIDDSLPDVRPSIKSASNPAPKGDLTKGVGFTMTQHMHAQSLPSGKLDATPFKDIPHIRQLEDRSGIVFVVKAGLDETAQDYKGPPAFRNATATPATIQASPPKPAGKGKWTRNEVTVTADAIPATATPRFSIVETGAARLGCDIDAASGVVSIGDKPGTITVRVSSGARGSHFDEVKIVVTAPPPPAPASP